MWIFLAAFFMIAQNLKQPRWPQLVNGYTYCNISVQWNNKKEQITDNMQQHGWITEPLCWMKEFRNKNYMPCDILVKAALYGQGTDGCLGVKGKLTTKGSKNFLGVMEMFLQGCIDLSTH